MDTLHHLGVQQVELHDLRVGGGVIHTSFWSGTIKVAVGLHRVHWGAQVGIDIVVATAGSGVFKENILAGSRCGF